MDTEQMSDAELQAEQTKILSDLALIDAWRDGLNTRLNKVQWLMVEREERDRERQQTKA